nr:MAG TPA: Trp-operon Leader Peptide [Caudoviricetes sp.]
MKILKSIIGWWKASNRWKHFFFSRSRSVRCAAPRSPRA